MGGDLQLSTLLALSAPAHQLLHLVGHVSHAPPYFQNPSTDAFSMHSLQAVLFDPMVLEATLPPPTI
jgi:hypothetical protein